jgi:hypothetical protein
MKDLKANFKTLEKYPQEKTPETQPIERPSREERIAKQEELMDDILTMHKLVRTNEIIPTEELNLTMDSLHEFLQKIIDTPVGLRRKLLTLHKFTKWWVDNKR